MNFADFIFFPIRALFVHEENRMGLTSLRNERMAYAASEVTGYNLDVGCGRHNLFIRKYLQGNGKGVDAFPRPGLNPDQILQDPKHFPFSDNTFDSATFVSSLNHIPKELRLVELKEAWRCLKPGGKIVITMGGWIIKAFSYQWVALHDKLFHGDFNWDPAGRGGLRASESYFLSKKTIRHLLEEAGFQKCVVKNMPTQWGLHFLVTAYKPTTS
ncbi:MAG: class I SAM-dependent methyltransferase [Deltaproteobacteria bacterium]|nr:class I SAM-dependent methyltransferase [Deltaproteobacteria bacterium]